MKTFLLVLYVIAFISTLFGIYLIFVNVSQSDIVGAGSILFAIACAVIPACAVYCLTKIIEYGNKQ